MQPYQQASQEILRSQKLPLKVAGAAAGIASTYALPPILSKIRPLLSELIPEGLALKGLSKANKNLGHFVSQSQDAGFGGKEILDFVRDKFESAQEESAKDDKNVIEKYSPELFQFIKGHVDKGRSPIEGAALAQLDTKFKPIIDKITKDNKAQWSQIVSTIFGNPKENALKQFKDRGKERSLMEQEQNRFFNAYGKPQASGGQDALIQALRDAKQILGG